MKITTKEAKMILAMRNRTALSFGLRWTYEGSDSNLVDEYGEVYATITELSDIKYEYFIYSEEGGDIVENNVTTTYSEAERRCEEAYEI